MVTENWNSRSQIISKDGDVVTQRLTVTWAEWNARTGIPNVGDAWSSARPDLVASQIAVEALDGTDDYAAVEITYSTQNAEAREEIENQVSSWHEELDFGVTEAPLVYWQDTTPADQRWRDIWLKAAPDGYAQSEDTLDASYPIVKIPTISMSITTYGDAWYISRILDHLTNVNSNYFLQDISARKSTAEAWYADDIASYDDRGMWMLVGCNTQRIRNNCWRYDWQFEFNSNKWDYWPVPGGTPHQLKYYTSYDFELLFYGMDLIEPDPDTVTRS